MKVAVGIRLTTHKFHLFIGSLEKARRTKPIITNVSLVQKQTEGQTSTMPKVVLGRVDRDSNSNSHFQIMKILISLVSSNQPTPRNSFHN